MNAQAPASPVVVPDNTTPLSTVSRILLGGAGAIAPLVVLAISVEWATVFSSLTWLVFFGYVVKASLLFVVGGFIAFLQKKETDEFKCFIFGISAPALITTYAASNAHATPLDELDRIRQSIRIETVQTAFSESSFSQFRRGFSGIDPQTAIAIVGQTNNGQNAILDAAAIELFVDCSIQGKVIGQRPTPSEGLLREQGLSSKTTVVRGDNAQFVVLANLGPSRIALGYLNFLRDDIDVSHVVVISSSKGSYEIQNAISEGIGQLPENLTPRLLGRIQPDCQWKGDY